MDKMIVMILSSNFCLSQPMIDYVFQSPTEVPSSDPLENLNMLDFYGQRPWRQGHQSKLIGVLIYKKWAQGSHRLEKYLNIQHCLEKSLKINFALKST